MNLQTRLLIYAAIITAYLLFGIFGSWDDIWPWGAVILGVPMLIAEIGTRLTTKNK